MDSVERTPVTTQQLSDLHAHLVEAFGQGIDPAKVREAVEASGFVWDRPEPAEPERRMSVEAAARAVMATWDSTGTFEELDSAVDNLRAALESER